jgi:hypothetical protein
MMHLPGLTEIPDMKDHPVIDIPAMKENQKCIL